jgi:Holliday junction resolvasome RuvABC endonuclease subunit
VTTLFDLTEAPAATTAAGPPARYRVAGLDISLTGTGVATLGGTTCIRTKGRRADSIPDRRARQKHIVHTALTEIGTVDLACVEGPSHASMGQAGHHDLSGLWWCIVGALVDRDIPVAVVPPMSRAKYATGKGNSRKAAVLEAARKRYGAILPNDNEADALILRAMGMEWLGTPLAEVPDGHRAALAGVQWPDREAVTRR